MCKKMEFASEMGAIYIYIYNYICIGRERKRRKERLGCLARSILTKNGGWNGLNMGQTLRLKHQN